MTQREARAAALEGCVEELRAHRFKVSIYTELDDNDLRLVLDEIDKIIVMLDEQFGKAMRPVKRNKGALHHE